MKVELITWLAGLPDDAPELKRVAAIRRGEETAPVERWQNLKEVAQSVRVDRSWLHRLGVPEVCGHSIAGGRRYRVSEVEAYLGSAECQARVARLREERQLRRVAA